MFTAQMVQKLVKTKPQIRPKIWKFPEFFGQLKGIFLFDFSMKFPIVPKLHFHQNYSTHIGEHIHDLNSSITSQNPVQESGQSWKKNRPAGSVAEQNFSLLFDQPFPTYNSYFKSLTITTN